MANSTTDGRQDWLAGHPRWAILPQSPSISPPLYSPAVGSVRPACYSTTHDLVSFRAGGLDFCSATGQISAQVCCTRKRKCSKAPVPAAQE
ncbi:hypothetical protein NQZ68_018195 [Dissostichus eleginoides]|nr:hypothetical protein NQZ68_018195 [Dissostichus eleginoides]